MNREQAEKLTKDALDQLVVELEGGRSKRLTDYLATMARFPQYSFRNVMLIASQRPDATHEGLEASASACDAMEEAGVPNRINFEPAGGLAPGDGRAPPGGWSRSMNLRDTPFSHLVRARDVQKGVGCPRNRGKHTPR
jgi:hypothetical protein